MSSLSLSIPAWKSDPTSPNLPMVPMTLALYKDTTATTIPTVKNKERKNLQKFMSLVYTHLTQKLDDHPGIHFCHFFKRRELHPLSPAMFSTAIRTISKYGRHIPLYKHPSVRPGTSSLGFGSNPGYLTG